MNYCGVEKCYSTVNDSVDPTCDTKQTIRNVVGDTRVNLEEIWNLLDTFDKFSFNADNRADAYKEITSDCMENAILLNREISFAIKDKLSTIISRYGC